MSGLHIGGVLAVLPVDTFTGQPVCTRDFSVEIEGARAPVRKSGGFFVFSHVLPVGVEDGVRLPWKADTVTIRFSGWGYREMTVQIGRDEIRADDPVLMVPVDPGRNYPFPPDTVRMEGKIPAHSCLKAALLQKTGWLRLAQDYSAGGRMIALCKSGQKQTAGNLFFAGDGSGESIRPDTAKGGVSGEFIRFDGIKRDADGSRFLEEPLARDLDRKKARLYPARMQEAGEREEYYFFAFRTYGGGRGPALSGEVFAEGEEAGTLFCRLETPEGVREYRVPVWGGETKIMDF